MDHLLIFLTIRNKEITVFESSRSEPADRLDHPGDGGRDPVRQPGGGPHLPHLGVSPDCLVVAGSQLQGTAGWVRTGDTTVDSETPGQSRSDLVWLQDCSAGSVGAVRALHSTVVILNSLETRCGKLEKHPQCRGSASLDVRVTELSMTS